MSHAPGLKAALKRGALIAAANWPLVVVQFVAESTLKLLLAVPVLGGIFLVALLLDADVGELISGSPSEIVQAVFNAMRRKPAGAGRLRRSVPARDARRIGPDVRRQGGHRLGARRARRRRPDQSSGRR